MYSIKYAGIVDGVMGVLTRRAIYNPYAEFKESDKMRFPIRFSNNKMYFYNYEKI